MTPDELRKLADDHVWDERCKSTLLQAADEIESLYGIAEAAASVATEEGVREMLLSYNMGCVLIERLDQYHRQKETK